MTGDPRHRRRSAWIVALLAGLIVAAAAGGADQASRDRNAIFTCGEDIALAQPIPVRWGTVVLAGDARQFIACPVVLGRHGDDHIELREAAVIQAGLGRGQTADFVPGARGGRAAAPPTPQTPLPGDVRWRAVQAFIRLGGGVGALVRTSTVTAVCSARALVFDSPDGPVRWQPGRLFVLARDPDPVIRQEAAYAIGTQLAAPDENRSADLVAAAAEEMRVCVQRETVDDVVGVMLESLGAMRYGSAEHISATEQFLVEQSRAGDPKRRSAVLGAMKGLEVLSRQNSKHTFRQDTRARLRQALTPGGRDADAHVRRLALMALRSMRDSDGPTLQAAATDEDWQVRRLVAMSLSLADPEQARLGEILARDLAFQVRYEILAPLQRRALATRACEPIAKFFDDPMPVVVLRALDVVPAECDDMDKVLPFVEQEARSLARPESHIQWHVPSRAFAALARLRPALAAPLVGAAIEHPVWQVRAAAAATSATLRHESSIVTLASDREPNVRNAALDALARLKSPALVPAAIEAIRSSGDYQLLRTAAISLRGLTDERVKDEATDALLRALRRLTDEETDTSRDTRVAILDRLSETMRPERSSDLLAYIVDYDDAVAAAARRAFTLLVGSEPGDPPKKRRYPFQPTEAELYALPSRARIGFDTGAVIIAFRKDVAPVTVARVVALIQQGYYNGKTFHRNVPNFVIQGGSPAMNEYAGVARFMRDEVGPQASHVRGAIGISTRGRDTGDAQLFIDLVDLPRLNRDYTVFAQVIEGMDVIDRLLEGAVIRSISIID